MTLKRRCITTIFLMGLMSKTLQADELLYEENVLSSSVEWQGAGHIMDECCNQSPSRFFIQADLLYWKTHLTGLELDFGTGTIAEDITDGLETITSTEFDADPHFKWNAGYRIGAGYQFACTPWEIGAVWTHFRDTGTRSKNEDADTVNRTKCSVKFNQFDLLLAYNECLGSSFNVKPFIGIRGAKIHESLEATLTTDITILPATAVTQTRFLDDHEHYWGIGPMIGIQGDWGVGCGFSLYGAIAGSLLYGKYKLHFDDSEIITAPISRQTFTTDKRHLHGFDCNLDLAIGIRWETCICDSYLLNMKLGFEHHQYFNNSRLGANRGDLTFDGGIFSLGLSL